ncbi:hypothetical protein U0070_002197, partial [Myodes glareolus]
SPESRKLSCFRAQGTFRKLSRLGPARPALACGACYHPWFESGMKSSEISEQKAFCSIWTTKDGEPEYREPGRLSQARTCRDCV